MNAAQMLSFEGHGIRVLEEPSGRMVPANDLADAVGRDRSSIHKIVRNDELLRSWVGMAVTATPSGNQETLCLSEPGVVRLLGMLNPERSATPGSRAKVMAFGRWAATTLVKVMRGEAVGPQGEWITAGEAQRRLNIPHGTIRGRVVAHNLPMRPEGSRQLLHWESLQAHFQLHPHAPAPKGAPDALPSASVLAELRRIYGPAGAQVVLHQMAPRLFPDPKTNGFQPTLGEVTR